MKNHPQALNRFSLVILSAGLGTGSPLSFHLCLGVCLSLYRHVGLDTSTTFTLEAALFACEDNLLVDWSEIAIGYGGMCMLVTLALRRLRQKDSVDF